ncbi:DUF1440 domain-containing protein [Pedobacter chinensis]|uniref:DUF1440 domain-containing protein n=1 Tax=Pedobacter chinensis TaxID=2282421 RepID=A0A369PWZ3_9SPHI|nr:DUF1440 domain-containing protein [Pedobacter chinensis]RDC57024.1 DUF1440 domain-containing protein [Pedobacter chinensis]
MKNPYQNPSFVKHIFVITLIAGTLDGLAAVIFLAKMKFASTFQYIVSAIFGKTAFEGGSKMVLAGLLLHYFITFIFVNIYMIVSIDSVLLKKQKIIAGIVYGIIVWSIMNLLVVPLTPIPHGKFNIERAVINCIVLILCIGLPISLLAARQNTIRH